MKNILAIIGGGVLLLFVGLIVLFIFIFINILPLQKEAEEYARETILAIATDWSAQAAMDRAAPEFIENASDGRLESVLSEGMRVIGGLTELGAINCNVNRSVSTGAGEVTTGNCTASAEHERGRADYQLRLIKRDGEWKMQGFHFTHFANERGPVPV